MSACVFKEGDKYFAIFGTSNGEVQQFWINFNKRRLEEVTKL